MASPDMICGTSAAICCDAIHAGDPFAVSPSAAPGWSSAAFEELMNPSCSACVDPQWLSECPDCETAAADHSKGVVDCQDEAACTACEIPPPQPPSELDEASFQHLLACCCCPPSGPTTFHYVCEWRGCTLQFPSHAALAAHVNHTHLGLPNFTASASSRSSSTQPATPLSQQLAKLPSVPSRCKWDDCQMDIAVPDSGDQSAMFFDHLLRHHLGPEASASPLLPPTPSLTPSYPPAPTPSTSAATLPTVPAQMASQAGPSTGDHVCNWVGCGLAFDSTAKLMAHVTDDHVGSGKATYICEWEDCPRAIEGRVFSQRQKVLRHMQTHTGDKPHACTICGKCFAEATTLAQHHRTHTREKPYTCTECGKSFALASALTIHTRTHTGDKPFACPEPGCTACFAESSNLRKHIRIHSGDRPFRCNADGCGKAFQRSDQLARHARLHEATSS